METNKVNLLCGVKVNVFESNRSYFGVKQTFPWCANHAVPQLIFILYDFNLQFEEEAKLVARFEAPGRPTCLTIIGQTTLPKQMETMTDETKMAVKSEKPLKAKKNKDNGKTGRSTARTSGSFVWRFLSEVTVI